MEPAEPFHRKIISPEDVKKLEEEREKEAYSLEWTTEQILMSMIRCFILFIFACAMAYQAFYYIAECYVAYLEFLSGLPKIIWTFLIAHPFIDAVVIMAMIVVANFLWNELNKPNRAVGVFDPAIVPPPWIRNQLPIARVNRGWRLAYRVGWIISLTTGVCLTLLSGVLNTADFLFSDMVTAMCKLNPELYKLAESQPWLGYAILTIVFLSSTTHSLKKTFWLAGCQSVAVRDDPRCKLLILLVDTIHGWNAQIPVFNDLAESGEQGEVVQRLLLKRTQLIDLMNRVERRLAVAPLGSFPKNSNVSELPEFKEPNTLVEELKREPCMKEAWKEVDALTRFFTGS